MGCGKESGNTGRGAESPPAAGAPKPDAFPGPGYVSPGTRIGWIGTGVMGAPMCGHLAAKGYRITVHTRTREKALGLLEGGAAWAESPRAAAEASDVVFSMVGYPAEVREVYFGERGILAGAKAGSVVVDMTTTEPQLAREVYAAAKERGVFAVDAPVSGGDVGARRGTLSIMAGGDREAVEAIGGLFELLGKNIVYAGPAGSGQHTKMCNQIVIAGTMLGVCESLLYGRRAGLDAETTLRAIGGGAAGCWTLENLAPRMVKGDYAPGFYVEHFIKDMGIALGEAERMGVAAPGLALAHQLYVAVRARGHGQSGTQALMLALEALGGEEGEEGEEG